MRGRYYFAYGTNMDAEGMRLRAPKAQYVSHARLPGYRFVISSSGWGSIAPDARSQVEGLLWWITPEDEAALDHYEGVTEHLYSQREVVVTAAGGARIPAMVYIATGGGVGVPQPGHLEAIAAAAHRARLSARAIRGIERWKSHR